MNQISGRTSQNVRWHEFFSCFQSRQTCIDISALHLCDLIVVLQAVWDVIGFPFCVSFYCDVIHAGNCSVVLLSSVLALPHRLWSNEGERRLVINWFISEFLNIFTATTQQESFIAKLRKFVVGKKKSASVYSWNLIICHQFTIYMNTVYSFINQLYATKTDKDNHDNFLPLQGENRWFLAILRKHFP